MLDAVPTMVASLEAGLLEVGGHKISISITHGSIGKPTLTERTSLGASSTIVYPSECRARGSTYAAPLHLTSASVNC